MKNELEIFDYLNDTGLNSIDFNFQKREMLLEFIFWDDLEQQEVPFYLKLSGISKFQSEYPENLDFHVIGCHSARVRRVEGNGFEATFLFDFLKNAVSWKVIVGFQEMEVTGGLSPAAFEEKYGLHK